MKKVSMQDIADKVGVSKCTVSLALSGKAKEKRITDSVCERILQVAKELNYEPNELARGLRTGQTKTIGVIVADISNEFFGELVYHIQRRAHTMGYSVIITNSDESPTIMLEQITLLINRRVDGIIMVPTNDSFNYANHIVCKGIPFVQIDRFLPGLEASYVVLDNFKASSELTKRLISKGCARIAMFRHKTSALNGRLEGYVQVLRDNGLYDEDLVKSIDYSSEDQDVEEAIDDLFGEVRKADSIIFQSHELFMLGTASIHKKKLSIPDEVKVACFDKTAAFALVDFPLTFVTQPVDQLAQEAVDILAGHISGSKEIVARVLEGKVEGD